MNGSGLLELLRVLETELHRLETRQNRNRLEQLLHPDFVEFARSGRRYSRSEVIVEFSGDCVGAYSRRALRTGGAW